MTENPEAAKPLDAPVRVPISAAEQMLRDRWKGDLCAIPLGKVVEFMQSYALAQHAAPAPGLRDDDADSILASATELLNTWAREIGVEQARTPEDIRGVIVRLWLLNILNKIKGSIEAMSLNACPEPYVDTPAKSVKHG